MNVLRFGIQCVIFLFVNCNIFLTMYYAHLADVNVGVITTIWAVQPLFGAILDKLIYDEDLKFSYIFGILLIAASSVCIGLKPAEASADGMVLKDFPKWPAILFAFITPCFFTGSGLFNKHLTNAENGFDATTMSVGTSFVSSVLVLILGVAWFWQQVEPFNSTLFVVGIFASILDTTGKVFIQRAFANGPVGPVAAVTECNNILLIIIDAIRVLKFPTWLEIVGFVLGISGGMVFAIPD